MFPAKYYTVKDKEVVQCNLCHHNCVIKNNATGICRARKNVDGELKSLVYGYPFAQNADPIEKKPFFHFLPGSLTHSLGTLGCNFACANCQNWDISQAQKLENEIDKLPYADPRQVVNEAQGNGCASIAYTYNEPTVFAEYALDIMKLAREEGLKNVWVSNGYMGEEALRDLLPYLDAINVDVKSFDEDFYNENCSARLDPVLQNIRALKDAEVHVELTTLLIPGFSDQIDMIEKLAAFIADELDDETPWHITKFSPEISWKLKDSERTSEELMYAAYEAGKNAGLKFVYLGNLPGDQKENTYCPKCNELCIRRLNYHIERLDDDGACPACGEDLRIVT